MAKSKLQSFTDQFVALVKGDEAAVLAEKVYRQKQAALTSHIASYKGDVIDLEIKVQDAKENLSSTRLNHGEMIEDRGTYIVKLVEASEKVKDAEEMLKAMQDLISLLEEELEK